MMLASPRCWAALLPALVLAAASVARAEPASLESYLQIRRELAEKPESSDVARLERRAGALRAALLRVAGRDSRVLATLERRPGFDVGGSLRLARLAVRDGRVTLEAFGGGQRGEPDWERAGEIAPEAFLALLGRLLDDPAVFGGLPGQVFDPNAPGPRRAAVLRLAIGEEEWALEALYGTPYERLSAVAAAVVEFARSIPLLP